MKTKLLAATVVALGAVPMAANAEFSLGAIASYSPETYKDTPQ